MYVPMLPLLVKSPKILGNYCLPWDLENIFFIYEPLKITVSALLILGKTWEVLGSYCLSWHLEKCFQKLSICREDP